MGSGGDLGTELFFFSRWRPKEILERDDRESKKNKIICLLGADVGVVTFKYRIN